MQQDAKRLASNRCTVTSRKNAIGHTVLDVVESGGLIRTMVLWEDKSAKVEHDGGLWFST